MANQATIGQNVVPIYPSGHQGVLTLLNIDVSDTIYVSDSTSLNIATGFPLGPGDAMIWDSQRPLFAVCVTGQQATLVIDENGGNYVSAGAIANDLIQAGLAQQIATYTNSLVQTPYQWSSVANDFPLDPSTQPVTVPSGGTIGYGYTNGYPYAAISSPTASQAMQWPFFPILSTSQLGYEYTYISWVAPTMWNSATTNPWGVAWGLGYNEILAVANAAWGTNIAQSFAVKVGYNSSLAPGQRTYFQISYSSGSGLNYFKVVNNVGALIDNNLVGFFQPRSVLQFQIISRQHANTLQGGLGDPGQTDVWIGCPGSGYVIHGTLPVSLAYMATQISNTNSNDFTFCGTGAGYGVSGGGVRGNIHTSELALGYSTVFQAPDFATNMNVLEAA